MSLSDLLTEEAQTTVDELNALIRRMYTKGAYMSSWTGGVPKGHPLKLRLKRFLGIPIEDCRLGIQQRLNYQSLPGAADDDRLPWFLYWEIVWAMKHTRQFLRAGMKLLDGGGASSLFACYLADQGYDVYTIDLNRKLVTNSDKIAATMGWNLHAYQMNLAQMNFPDGFFDHAYSICVFEHLDYDTKQGAMREIARVLKPGGRFTMTFDYRNPAPGVVGIGKDPSYRNAIRCQEDISRQFLATGLYEVAGNLEFQDNSESYLVHPLFPETPYSFGALFLKKKT